MRSLTGVLAVILFVCLLGACAKSLTNPETNAPTGSEKRVSSTDVVKVTVQPVELTPGGSAAVSIHLAIQSGYHVNANPPTYPYLKATEVQIPATDGLSVGFIVYPDAVTKTFPFAEQPIAIYEGETTLKVDLKADKTANKGERRLAAKVQVQACDDQVCYAPGMIDLSIPVSIK
jgi:hypothetical protein